MRVVKKAIYASIFGEDIYLESEKKHSKKNKNVLRISYNPKTETILNKI